ncbi:aminoglycoside phosphotransferase family protein [Streptomyces sp. HU2014]|uniref:phosphotransferase n=1 Tax=Streptomyces sp. HU2014 TaxID=2939414 RepID=UPI00200ED950|nr:phosphotransferase [Streptomyces sp. HU2014]UQI45503.1 aminoglycoside phosphotransferase family protein [Streptomyces sp. HU2014]
MRHDEEQPLSGGNVSEGVVRVGDTVRRPAGPWTPAVHALLTHLHDVGFRAAPRPLGIDERGREVLTFLPGDVVWPDRFALLEPSRRLARVARLIRDFHDAVAGFTPPAGARWQALVPAEGDDIIAHHDLAPWNLVAGGPGGGDGWAFIDWDAAGPGSRLWDVAYAVHGFVPLSADPAWRRADAAYRLRVFADAYRLDETERRRLVPLLGRRTRSMHDFLRDRSARGDQPWARLWAEGHGDIWRRDSEYVERREEEWERALLYG